MKFVVKTSSVTKEFTDYLKAKRYYWSEKAWSKGPVSLTMIDGKLKYVYDSSISGFLPLNHWKRGKSKWRKLQFATISPILTKPFISWLNASASARALPGQSMTAKKSPSSARNVTCRRLSEYSLLLFKEVVNMFVYILMYEDSSKILGVFSNKDKARDFARSILGERARSAECSKGEYWTDNLFSYYIIVKQYVY